MVLDPQREVSEHGLSNHLAHSPSCFQTVTLAPYQSVPHHLVCVHSVIECVHGATSSVCCFQEDDIVYTNMKPVK